MPCCCNRDEVIDFMKPTIITLEACASDHCSAIFFTNCCGMFHFALLVVYFLIMVTYVCVIFVAKVDFFNDPHALCRSIGRQAFIDSMFVSMCAIGFGLFCLLMQMIQKIENAEYARLIFRCLLFYLSLRNT